MIHFDNSAQDLSIERKIFFARTEAGWYLDDSGWYAPDGTHESRWDGVFPEEHLF
ncbi:hypothetical protein [Limnobacter sp.]|uniref:hypothetical protein n=1 Tax=Limnobacter sp. TaxID=2003368 RepID=UPI0025BF4F05|nr:hypothetical protein [Limnobacter sp.]